MGAELGKIYSKRYCYSMIAFYQFCVKYPRMKYAGIGFSQYKDRMMVRLNFLKTIPTFGNYNKLLQFKIIYSKYSLNNLVIQLIYKYVYKQSDIRFTADN